MNERIWDARFATSFSHNYFDISTSFPIDENLLKDEIWASAVHIRSLASAGEIDCEVAHAIISCLYSSTNDTNNVVSSDNEDIHTSVEKYLIKCLGVDIAGFLSLGRSRNTQVNVVTRLFIREEVEKTQLLLLEMLEKMNNTVTITADWPMAGVTHAQPAQVITVGYWIMSYIKIFQRIINRYSQELSIQSENFCGGGALAGTSLNYDYNLSKDLLDFNCNGNNSLDGVSNQDFNLSIQMINALCCSSFTRLLSELIIFASPQFGYIELSDSLGMGSSYMPQKKNPSVLEIMRAKCTKIYGNVFSSLADINSLLSGYNRDFQVIKENLINSIIELQSIIKSFAFLWDDLIFSREKFYYGTNNSGLYMAECANFISKKKNISFREAYAISGKAVSLFDSVDDICKEIIIETSIIDKDFEKNLRDLFSANYAVYRYKGKSSSNPEAVKKIAQETLSEIKQTRYYLNMNIQKHQKAFEKTFSF